MGSSVEKNSVRFDVPTVCYLRAEAASNVLIDLSSCREIGSVLLALLLTTSILSLEFLIGKVSLEFDVLQRGVKKLLTCVPS